ncbi:hypothetical protein GF360_01550 [candidate division WWE3 bacterium]|nr:hypothetical protein [candidate division WWE3 bacterium]
MKFTKKFYFSFALLLTVSALSYTAFITFSPRLLAKVSESVKGTYIHSEFSYLPSIEDATEISANYKSEGFERSFVMSQSCENVPQRFYKNVLTADEWIAEKTESKESYQATTYKKGTQKIRVASFDDPEKDECLITLVGYRSE